MFGEIGMPCLWWIQDFPDRGANPIVVAMFVLKLHEIEKWTNACLLAPQENRHKLPSSTTNDTNDIDGQ